MGFDNFDDTKIKVGLLILIVTIKLSYLPGYLRYKIFPLSRNKEICFDIKETQCCDALKLYIHYLENVVLVCFISLKTSNSSNSSNRCKARVDYSYGISRSYPHHAGRVTDHPYPILVGDQIKANYDKSKI